jgi:hypothetical protein
VVVFLAWCCEEFVSEVEKTGIQSTQLAVFGLLMLLEKIERFIRDIHAVKYLDCYRLFFAGLDI